MAYTGYIVSVYQDCNPYSETYGQERTERVLDTNSCPVQQPANYVEVYTYCEMTQNGAYTGNCVRVFEDVEPMSATYGQQMEEVYTDGVLCPPDSAEADWQQIDQYCEQIAYQPSGKLGNSGYQITVFQDMGSFSPTYGQTRENREQDIVHCPLPDTSDVWVIISETCHLADGLKDGTKDVVRVNTNEYSPNYNDGASETINVPDLELCPLDPESPIWTETSYVCVLDEGYRTGYVTVTEEDTNPQSASYGQTRTRTYQDEERCPYQEKPQPVSLKWRVINNRGASTDTITSITLHFNSNFDIDILGSIAPAGGMLQGTVLLPASLTSTGLVCASIELSPNTSSPTIFQFSQTPNPFVWDNTSGSAVLTVTLWDGDGTGPEWTEVSYTCETVDGYRTGAAIVVEEDMNPNSATYGEQRTRTIENDTRCPAQTDANWVETSWSCEQVNGFNTGNRLSVQTDQNPNSSTYGSTRTRIIYDTENCPLDTTPNWVEISYVCEQVDGHNTGNVIATEIDNNPGSATYNTTRTRTYEDTARCPVTPSYHYKLKTTSSGGTDTFVSCNNNTTLEKTEVVDRNCVSAVVGDCVSTIGYQTFEDCTHMGSIFISDSVTTISERAFRNCDGLTSVTIPSSVTGIGPQAFYSCNGLTGSLVIPSSVTGIGYDAFYGCNHLTSVTLLSDSLVRINSETFKNCSGLTSVSLPSNVIWINSRAFDGCSQLTSITLPSVVTLIDTEAFNGCTSLNSITCLATTPPTLGNNAFYRTNNCPIYVPAESVNTYKSASGWSSYASRIFAIPS